MIGGKVKLDLKNLAYVRGSLQNKAIRIAINKAAVPVKDAVVASAPKDVGHLKASIRIKTRYYKKSKTWAAIVGPSNSFKRVRKKPKKVKAKKPNKTVQGIKKRLASLKQQTGRKLAKTLRQTAGRKGRRIAQAIKDYTAKPKPVKTPKKKRLNRNLTATPFVFSKQVYPLRTFANIL